MITGLLLKFNSVVYADFHEDVPGDYQPGQVRNVPVPSMPDILTFVIRMFFVVGGLLALLYLLLGALAWITSGGNKEGVDKARDRITAAVIGLILIFVVVGLVALLETILDIGLGLTRTIVFPCLVNCGPS